ncbi:Serine/threonine-protein kinase HT1 [Acorus gramineus]|uniref:non-specific serine/threonine protein kinase n=1 Tax=Acorus gramineus TaxID=55184 RepID=A0AAV9AJQ4_ACOGR|nr:Serine/threonine-protein kinase HT1 [Acorus gramineus]
MEIPPPAPAETVEEGVGESSSPPRGAAGALGLSPYDVKNEVYNRLVEDGRDEAVWEPGFRDLIEAHFARLPPRYAVDVDMERAEDVLLHQRILAEARDPEKRPVFRVRVVKCPWTKEDGHEDLQQSIKVFSTSQTETDGDFSFHNRNRDCGVHFEPCSKLEDLNLDMRRNFEDAKEKRYPIESSSGRQIVSKVPVHEIIFSTVDKPKLLSQFSALLSNIGLNIREAHVFSTTDGYSLDVFVVDGWHTEEADELHKALKIALAGCDGSLSGTSSSHSISEKELHLQPQLGEWAIDRRLLRMGEKIACGAFGELYHGTYLGQDVAIKLLRPSEQLNQNAEAEFAQEVTVLREVQHRNVVRFVGACAKLPQLCIVTEYMAGGSLHDFLHMQHNVLELKTLLKFAIDISKGMDYLHQNNIIHRDLKTANLLMDENQVVKVADFGVARFQNQGGEMTAETGTYRWMAPEVINHQPYDQRADVFSFAIVLWELATSKIPYDTMTPLQAAVGVRQGMRPEIPENIHPKLLHLMQRCWAADPDDRPSFTEITIELEKFLQEIQEAQQDR